LIIPAAVMMSHLIEKYKGTSAKDKEIILVHLLHVRYLSADNGSFLAFQLSLDIILRLDQNDFARQELFSMCRANYHNDRLK